MASKTKDKYEIGTHVVLKGLVGAHHLNGRAGKVAVAPEPGNIRVGVDLLNPWIDPQTGNKKHVRLSIKPENLAINRYLSNDMYAKTSRDRIDGRCDNCKKRSNLFEMKVCGKCKVAQYCSKDCQSKLHGTVPAFLVTNVAVCLANLQ